MRGFRRSQLVKNHLARSLHSPFHYWEILWKLLCFEEFITQKWHFYLCKGKYQL